MGRLWQTLILLRWKPLFAWLPVESVIRERQSEYYRVLVETDRRSDASLFVEFMLKAMLDTIKEAAASDPVSDQVTDRVKRLVKALAKGELGAAELMAFLGLSHKPTFRKNYLTPALEQGLIERTQPDSPRSPTQRYRLTGKGHGIVNETSL